MLNEEPGGNPLVTRFVGKVGKSRSKTRIAAVMTDGSLLNRLREDPELQGVNAVVFDESSERA
jgi:HrpA-like RNA helicase